jgi:Aldehyde dehydrogenase family
MARFTKTRFPSEPASRVNRILVQDGVHDASIKRMAETTGAMKVADGFEPGAVIGPLIDMKAVEKGPSNTASSASTRASSRPKACWRDRALRRHEGKRHRPHRPVHWGSKYAIEEFLEVKYLCIGGIDR